MIARIPPQPHAPEMHSPLSTSSASPALRSPRPRRDRAVRRDDVEQLEDIVIQRRRLCISLWIPRGELPALLMDVSRELCWVTGKTRDEEVGTLCNADQPEDVSAMLEELGDSEAAAAVRRSHLGDHERGHVEDDRYVGFSAVSVQRKKDGVCFLNVGVVRMVELGGNSFAVVISVPLDPSEIAGAAAYEEIVGDACSVADYVVQQAAIHRWLRDSARSFANCKYPVKCTSWARQGLGDKGLELPSVVRDVLDLVLEDEDEEDSRVTLSTLAALPLDANIVVPPTSLTPPSVGSRLHPSSCQPCHGFARRGVCKQGAACDMCHETHLGKQQLKLLRFIGAKLWRDTLDDRTTKGLV